MTRELNIKLESIKQKLQTILEEAEDLKQNIEYVLQTQSVPEPGDEKYFKIKEPEPIPAPQPPRELPELNLNNDEEDDEDDENIVEGLNLTERDLKILHNSIIDISQDFNKGYVPVDVIVKNCSLSPEAIRAGLTLLQNAKIIKSPMIGFIKLTK